MDETAMRLECLRLAAGDLTRAQSYYDWLTGEARVNVLITAKMVERELIRVSGSPCSVTEGADGLFLVSVADKAKAVRFTESERSLSMSDFSDQVLKPLLEKFAS